MTFRVLLLDYACVIATPQSRDAYERLVALTGHGEAEYDVAFAAARDPYDLGTITAHAYWSAVAGRALSATEAQLIADTETASWQDFDEDLLAIAEAHITRGGEVALLSNLPVELASAVRATGRLAAFRELFFSYEHGLMKPDPAFFRLALDALAVAPSEVLFVDDRADNTAAAEALGIRALQWTPPGDHAALREILGLHS